MALVSRSAILGKAIPAVEDAVQQAVAGFAAEAAATAEAALLPEHEHEQGGETEVFGRMTAAPGRGATSDAHGSETGSGRRRSVRRSSEMDTTAPATRAPHHSEKAAHSDRTTVDRTQPGHSGKSGHTPAGTHATTTGRRTQTRAAGATAAGTHHADTTVSMPTTTVAASVATITTATAVAGPENHTGDAAAAPAMPPGPIALILSFAIVAVAGVIAYGMPAQKPFQISSAMAAYGALLVFATAVERIIEPFTHWLPGRHATNVYEHQLADLMNGKPGVTSATVALAKAHADRATSDRAHIAWGMATALAILAAASSGFYLLHMISASDFATSVPTWADAILTGLVVGSGTKPLHDLISRAQTSKDPGTPPS